LDHRKNIEATASLLIPQNLQQTQSFNRLVVASGVMWPPPPLSVNDEQLAADRSENAQQSSGTYKIATTPLDVGPLGYIGLQYKKLLFPSFSNRVRRQVLGASGRGTGHTGRGTGHKKLRTVSSTL